MSYIEQYSTIENLLSNCVKNETVQLICYNLEQGRFSWRRMIIISNYKRLKVTVLMKLERDTEQLSGIFLLVKLTRQVYYGYLIDISINLYYQQIKMQKKSRTLSIKLTNCSWELFL